MGSSTKKNRNSDNASILQEQNERAAKTLLHLGGIREAAAAFRFCPACASPKLYSVRDRMWVCPDCGFEYFHNVATAAGIIIEVNGSIVVLKRAKEPRKGSYALPGGFVESGERAEDAALRECREEIGWAPEKIEFLASYPNIYKYHNIPYATCDLYFSAKVPSFNSAELDIDPEETSEVLLLSADTIPWDMIAFESAQRALRKYLLSRSIGLPPRSMEWEVLE